MERRLELKAVARAIGSPKSTMRGGLCQTKGLHGNRGGASQVGWSARSVIAVVSPCPCLDHQCSLLKTCDCQHGRDLHRNYHLVRPTSVPAHDEPSFLSTV